LKELMVVVEGFPTYGGLAGRDLEAVARGLEEVTDPSYLKYRTQQTAWLGERLAAVGARVIRPVGGHAVFVDAQALYPQIPADQFPGQALSVAMYREGGVRTVEIGSLMFGGEDPNTGIATPPAQELVRFAIPRRVYTASHFEHVIRTFATVSQQREKAVGLTIEYQAPFLRHFTARLRECQADPARVTRA
jgi:tryptophanase